MHAGPTRAADLAPLVKELQRRADGNHDGQVTSTEFGDFLTGLLQKAGTLAGDAAQAAASSASPAVSPATLPAAALASLRHLTPQYLLAQLLASCPPESSSSSASAVTPKE
jgi:hypothetical protein